MLKNYFKIALRNIIRHKAYSAINIAGLAIGMATSILILLWVQNELSFDRFHKKANEIYRLTASAGDFKAAVSPAGMGGGLQQQMPVIKNYVRFSHPTSILLEIDKRKFEEKNGFYADSTLLEVFDFKLLQGSAATAMQRPDAILITAAMAKKYFGSDDPIGKILRKDNDKNVTVTAVFANLPSNSHLQFDFIMPTSAVVQQDYNLKNNTWNSFNFYSYLQLDKNFAATPGGPAAIAAANRPDL